MKKLIKSIIIAAVLLQANFTFASTLDNVKLEDLATNIAQSKEGKDYLSYLFAYGMCVKFSALNLTESEKQAKIEKLQKFENVAYKDLSDASKKEFSEAIGIKNHASFNDLHNGYIEAETKLKKNFPDFDKLNKGEVASVIESAYGKTDIFKHLETMKEGFWSCFGKKTALLSVCVGVTAGFTRLVFQTCLCTSIAGEIAATGPASIPFLAAILGVDVTTCAYVSAGLGGSVALFCVEAFINGVFGCW
jgi:hypothetical protein